MSDVQDNTIVEVFGQFGIQVAGKLKLLATRGEAELAVATAAVGEAAHARAAAYCAFKNIEAKNAQGKINILTDFLSWEAAGSPEYVAPAPKAEVVVDAPDEAPEIEA